MPKDVLELEDLQNYEVDAPQDLMLFKQRLPTQGAEPASAEKGRYSSKARVLYGTRATERNYQRP